MQLIPLDTGSTAGNISFTGAIDGHNPTSLPGAATLSNFDDHLILASGTGTFTFGGNIGDTLALTSLQINTAGSGTVDFTVPQLGGGGSVGVTGAVNLGNASGGHITFSGSGANAFDIGGKLTLNSAGGADSFKFTNDATITADGGIEMLNGGIHTYRY